MAAQFCGNATSYLVAAGIGVSVIPPVVLRDGPLGPGSMQPYIGITNETVPAHRRPQALNDLLTIAALHVLLNETDGKRGHLRLTTSGNIRDTDKGLTFNPDVPLHTPLSKFSGYRLPLDVSRGLAGLLGDRLQRDELREHLRLLLGDEEVAAFFDRAEKLARERHLPHIDSLAACPWDQRGISESPYVHPAGGAERFLNTVNRPASRSGIRRP